LRGERRRYAVSEKRARIRSPFLVYLELGLSAMTPAGKACSAESTGLADTAAAKREMNVEYLMAMMGSSLKRACGLAARESG
jgi:hypothetical protein